MSQSPTVSIVIPTYNRADYIAETIESVLAQTYPLAEIIVIDDGSTDNTREIVAKFEPQVKYVWQKNAERGAARNHGLRSATGEYIAFLDSDDVWLPNKIEQEINIFNSNQQAGLVYSDVQIIDVHGNFLHNIKRKGFSGKVTAHLLRDNFVSIGSHLIKTQVALASGGFREERQLSGSEDWEFWVRLSTQVEFAHLPQITAKIRTHPNNTMTNAAGMERSMSYAYELVKSSNYLSLTQKNILPKTRAWLALINAINYCSNGDRKIAADFLLKALKNNAQILLDKRFGYVVMKILVGNDILKQLYIKKT